MNPEERIHVLKYWHADKKFVWFSKTRVKCLKQKSLFKSNNKKKCIQTFFLRKTKAFKKN